MKPIAAIDDLNKSMYLPENNPQNSKSKEDWNILIKVYPFRNLRTKKVKKEIDRIH